MLLVLPGMAYSEETSPLLTQDDVASLQRAADEMGADYVLSYKCNPAYVASGTLDLEPARAEVERVIEAAKVLMEKEGE